jgi:E3 ubiquitin-protein ligase synoviolin
MADRHEDDDASVVNDQNQDPEISEMERLMALQEQEEHQVHVLPDQHDVEPQDPNVHRQRGGESKYIFRLQYSTVSFLMAFLHVAYVLRTRKQAYLALLYLTSSKLSYIIIGNALLAFLFGIFQFAVRHFLNGLRLIESETIVDHIRWNVTETCISMTMFRQEISVKTVIIFLFIILGKCLHWATELRVNHLRMTEEVFFFLNDEDGFMFDNTRNEVHAAEGAVDEVNVWWFWRAINIFMPKFLSDKCFEVYRNMPRVRMNHLKIMGLMGILHLFDMLSVTYCVSQLLDGGEAIFVMFLFETSVLMVSMLSSGVLYGIHVFDGCINVLQRLIIDRHETHPDGHDDVQVDDNVVSPEGGSVDDTNRLPDRADAVRRPENDGLSKYLLQRIASVWRDQRVTLTFMVELMALGSKFLFHLTLFVTVFSLYGLPINIIRDFYVAYNKLKQRLIVFSSYRRLTCNMDSRFESVTTEEELDNAGRICIICRDRMEVQGIHGDCKKLPMCNHTFHKYCLREWLVQQQNCPTCRGDIQENEARAKTLMQQQASPENDTVREEENAEAQQDEQVMNNVNDGMQTIYKEIPYPVLCKVIAPHGAMLFEITSVNSRRPNIEPLRRLKCGSLVVCTATLEFERSRGSLYFLPRRVYMKTPGGYIPANHVKEILELRPSEITNESSI